MVNGGFATIAEVSPDAVCAIVVTPGGWGRLHRFVEIADIADGDRDPVGLVSAKELVRDV